jgi:hypothetical protein
MKQLLAALTLSVFATAASAAEYTCAPTLLGMCKTIYTGTATAADVDDYLTDASTSIKWMLEDVGDIGKVLYDPAKGIVVVDRSGDKRIGPKKLRLIQRTMAERGLHVKTVAERTRGGSFVVEVYRSNYDVGGYSRFLVLDKIPRNKNMITTM